jgi:hypothetical protein
LDFAIVGCSLDALDAEDKLAMKLAYLYALREGVVEEALARGRARDRVLAYPTPFPI